jgi:hypothetical protein
LRTASKSRTPHKVVEIVFWEYQFHDPAGSGPCRAQTISVRREHSRQERQRARRFQSVRSKRRRERQHTGQQITAFKENVLDQSGRIFRRFDLAKKAWNLAEVKEVTNACCANRGYPVMCKGLWEGMESSAENSETKTSHHRRRRADQKSADRCSRRRPTLFRSRFSRRSSGRAFKHHLRPRNQRHRHGRHEWSRTRAARSFALAGHGRGDGQRQPGHRVCDPALRVGAFDYITKPIDLRHVEASVERALKHSDSAERKAPLQGTDRNLLQQRTAEVDWLAYYDTVTQLPESRAV